MANVVGYHRPSSIAEVAGLLAAPGKAMVVMGGGTVVNADTDPRPIEVIDLQDLGLDTLDVAGDVVRVGATTTIDALMTGQGVPELIANLARRELPSTLRTLGTVGGLIATADPESELLASLLAHDATVETIDETGASERPLGAVLEEGPRRRLMTAVAFVATGVGAVARTARTPADRPIVAAVGRKSDDGETKVAICGVARHPVVVDDVESLEPPTDFRGSSEYRKHLARTLVGRVREQLG